MALLADPSQCNYTTRSIKIAVTFELMMQFLELYDIIFNCLHYILPFWLNGAIKAGEAGVTQWLNLLMTTVFVEQLLSLPGSVKYWYQDGLELENQAGSAQSKS